MSVDVMTDPAPQLARACQALRSVCDGAATNDEQGFNKVDAYLGHRLAALPVEQWTPDMQVAAYDVLSHYQTQLTGLGIDFSEIQRPARPATESGRGWKRLFEGAKERADREAKAKAAADKAHRKAYPVNIGVTHDNRIGVSFDYDPQMVAGIKQLTVRGFWNKPYWVFPKTIAAVQALIPFVQLFGKDGTPALLNTLANIALDIEREGPVDEPPPLSVKFTREGLQVRFEYDSVAVHMMKDAGLRWDKEDRFWYGPFTATAAEGVAKVAGHLAVALDPETSRRLLQKIEMQAVNLATSSALAPTKDFHIPTLTKPLRPFQKAGVEFLIRNKAALLADQMGLGKTVQALAAVIAQDAFPVIVVTPASLKYNWQAEVYKWAPRLRTEIVIGRKPWPWIGKYNVIIINYDILQYHVEALLRLNPQALIVDEAHLVKNAKTQRTKAVRAMARAIPIKYLLTGTPVLNRPAELAVPLGILGKLDEFGGYWKFIAKYCNARETRFGTDTSGASNLDELSVKLRASCMIRRTTRDVFTELPPIERVTLPVDIDNRAEYQRAEEKLLDYVAEKARADKVFNAEIAHLPEADQERLRNERAMSAVQRAAAAEVLVGIETLKQVAIRGKMKQVIDWVNNYLDGTDDKILIFAHHANVQAELAKAFPRFVQVLGETTAVDRQAAVNKFQGDPQTRGAVLSLMAGSVGLTLTEARHVLFVEFGWRPADHDQAEARAYGRVNDPHPVTAYFMTGRGTIDEEIMTLLETKRAVADTIHDGGKGKKADITVSEIIAALRKRAGVKGDV